MFWGVSLSAGTARLDLRVHSARSCWDSERAFSPTHVFDVVVSLVSPDWSALSCTSLILLWGFGRVRYAALEGKLFCKPCFKKLFKVNRVRLVVSRILTMRIVDLTTHAFMCMLLSLSLWSQQLKGNYSEGFGKEQHKMKVRAIATPPRIPSAH